MHEELGQLFPTANGSVSLRLQATIIGYNDIRINLIFIFITILSHVKNLGLALVLLIFLANFVYCLKIV